MTAISKLIREAERRLEIKPGSFVCEYKVSQWTVGMLYDFLKSGTLVISPLLQRGYVWNEDMASLLIDSIWRGFIIPPLIFAKMEREGKTVYYVVDGVQRLTTIKRYIEGQLVPKGSVDKAIRNKKFSDLHKRDRDKFLLSPIPVMEITVFAPREIQTAVIVEMLRRMNVSVKRWNFVQVILCTIPTQNILIVRDVAQSTEFRQLFNFTEKELNELKDAYLSLALHLSFMEGEPLNLTASYKQRYVTLIADFIFNADSEEVKRTSSEILDITRICLTDLKLSREWFTPRFYGIYKKQKRDVISIPLTETIFLAIRQICVRRGTRLTLPEGVKPEDIRETIRETITRFEADGKNISEIYNEIIKAARVRYLKMLYSKLVEALKVVVTA